MRIPSFLFISFLSLSTFGQNESDVFRYSKTYHSGSARFEAMGGAFGAIGADVSAVQINPAGMGRFSNSQFSFSLGPTIASSTGVFENETTKDNRTSFSIPSFGLVITNDASTKNSGNMYTQIGFGMNRIANFNQNITYTGEQNISLLDGFAAQATNDGIYPEELYIYYPFSTSIAWDAWAINYDAGTNSYYSDLKEGDYTRHTREITSKGGINEWFLSYSANRLNKLYYGGAIAFRTSKFEESFTHNEVLIDTSTTSLRGFDYEYALKTKGTGVNLKIGAIYLFSDAFRIGAAFHTPTFTTLTDDWTANMSTYFNDSTKTVPEEFIPVGNYEYRLNTPLKAVISSAYVIGLNALISADIEYIGYNMGRLKSSNSDLYGDYNFETENGIIKQVMKSAFNYRIGAEYSIQQKLFLRAGFSYYSPAFISSAAIETTPDLSYSGGIGYRKNRLGIDLAFVTRTTNRIYYAFDGSTAEVKNSINTVVITGSIRF